MISVLKLREHGLVAFESEGDVDVGSCKTCIAETRAYSELRKSLRYVVNMMMYL